MPSIRARLPIQILLDQLGMPHMRMAMGYRLSSRLRSSIAVSQLPEASPHASFRRLRLHHVVCWACHKRWKYYTGGRQDMLADRLHNHELLVYGLERNFYGPSTTG